MRASIRVASKVYFRSLIHLTIFIILGCVSNFYLAKLSNSAVSLAEFHLGSLKLGVVGYITFCFLSYEYLRKATACSIKETIDCVGGAEAKLIVSQLVILLVLLLLWCTNIYGWIVASYIDFQTKYTPFLIHAFQSVILDLFLPGVIALLIGAVLSLSLNRELAYCVIIITALVCSPVPSKLFASEKIFGHSILSLLDWFSILAPNTDWVADTMYGVSIESCRWFLAAFWVFLLVGIILFRLSSHAGRKRIVAIATLIAVMICGARFLNRANDSVVRKDYRPEGTLNGEFSFRVNNPETGPSAPDFSVSRYNIELTIKSNTEADVVVQLNDNKLSTFRFTLFHSFDVKCIETADGKALEFDRCGDYITVYATEGTRELHFQYYGNAGKYYANYQGVALPGYIPYYPIPGHIQLWDSSKNEVVVDTEREMSYYEVVINSPLTIASNLKCTGDNSFSGYAEAVSLYAGMLEPAETEGLTYFVSPIGHQSLNLKGYQQVWNELASKVGESTTFDLTGKVIFLQPMTILATNATQETFVEFDDHIIVGGWAPSADDICFGYLNALIPAISSTDMLRTAFIDYLSFGGVPADSAVSWADVEILMKYESVNEITDDDEWFAYIDAANIFTELFNLKVDQLGEEYVLKAVYQYLHNPTVHQVEFLYRLGE